MTEHTEVVLGLFGSLIIIISYEQPTPSAKLLLKLQKCITRLALDLLPLNKYFVFLFI